MKLDLQFAKLETTCLSQLFIPVFSPLQCQAALAVLIARFDTIPLSLLGLQSLPHCCQHPPPKHPNPLYLFHPGLPLPH